MLAGGGAEAGGGDSGVMQLRGVAHVPAFEAVGGDLGMELQGQGEVFDGKGLMGVEFCLARWSAPGGRSKVSPCQ